MLSVQFDKQVIGLKMGKEQSSKTVWHYPHDTREVLQNEFRYDFHKGPREISAGTVFTVFTCVFAFNTVITVPAENSRGPFRKSYRDSFCKTSLLCLTVLQVFLMSIDNGNYIRQACGQKIAL